MMINPASVHAVFGDTASRAATIGASLTASNDPAGFASLLRQTQAAPAPMAPVAPPAPSAPPAPAATAGHAKLPTPAESKPTNEPARTTDADQDAPSTQDAETAGRTRALRGRPRPTDGTPVSTRESKGVPETTDPTDTPVTPAAEVDERTRPAETCMAQETRLTATAPAIDPSVMHWLAALQSAAADTGDQTVTGDAEAPLTGARGAAKGLRAAELKADAELKSKASQGKAQLAEAAGANPFAGVLAEPRKVDKPTLPLAGGISAVGGGNDIAAAAGALAPAATHTTHAPAPVEVPIATPVTSTDFAQALGLRLAMLAKDGVQTAELHLNPAEMGPVSVQIVMDGTQARVDFGADMAATRQAIEAGLPELASALRDAGFTLAGGGVSQHAGGRSNGNEPGTSDSRRERGIVIEDDVKRIATAARRIVTNGGVDLFA